MTQALRTVFTDNGPEQFEFDFIPKEPTYSDVLSLTHRSCSTCIWQHQKCAHAGKVCDGWDISEPDYQKGRAEYYRHLQQTGKKE